MARVKRVTIVLAKWCPHCVPLSLNYAQKMADELEVPLRVLDIDIAREEKTADRLVEKFGDYVEDYIIPQVFLESEGGKTEHIFTGFSESVSTTESRWISLLKSRFYQSLLEARKKGDSTLDDFVQRHLVFKVECRRHCDKPADFKVILTTPDGVVGGYICPGGFVSRVVYFSLEPNLDWFYAFLSGQLGKELVEQRDLRTATRHGWELDEGAAAELACLTSTLQVPLIKEAYWVYHPKNDVEKTRGVFLCSDPKQEKGYGRLFVQETTSGNRLCPMCM
ncbi:thioredoxin family protein [Candidatus Bathyarchaeota archaeon]|nr:thioredoxin family protein [Candidatus Bathyarchaeota archaeon]